MTPPRPNPSLPRKTRRSQRPLPIPLRSLLPRARATTVRSAAAVSENATKPLPKPILQPQNPLQPRKFPRNQVIQLLLKIPNLLPTPNNATADVVADAAGADAMPSVATNPFHPNPARTGLPPNPNPPRPPLHNLTPKNPC